MGGISSTGSAPLARKMCAMARNIPGVEPDTSDHASATKSSYGWAKYGAHPRSRREN